MDKPSCPGFGKYWEVIPGPAGDNCRKCLLKNKCLAKFATIALPEALKQVGTSSLSALADYLEVDEQAVLLAMAYTPRPKQTPVTKEKRNMKSPKNKKLLENKGKKKKRNGKQKAKKKKRKGTWQWGEHTHEARWNQERERNPVIAQLTPGMQLKTTYKGVTYTAVVKKGGYIHNENGKQQTFPTLHMLTEYVAGIYVRRNTVGFWDLARKVGGQ